MKLQDYNMAAKLLNDFLNEVQQRRFDSLYGDWLPDNLDLYFPECSPSDLVVINAEEHAEKNIRDLIKYLRIYKRIGENPRDLLFQELQEGKLSISLYVQLLPLIEYPERSYEIIFQKP